MQIFRKIYLQVALKERFTNESVTFVGRDGRKCRAEVKRLIMYKTKRGLHETRASMT